MQKTRSGFSIQEAEIRATSVSETTERPYGIKRVCKMWDIPRSTFYQKKARESEPTGTTKPGPVPEISDEKMLEIIREDLKNSPFSGEGHRKVWARLKFEKGVHVSRNRILRLMRENNLLSPHRRKKGQPQKHDKSIIVDTPDTMWGTDGVRIFTLDDGWVWLFTAVEHWNAEVVGWHVAKKGDRFAALEPVSQGLERYFGVPGEDVARGLALRMDHGSQYLSDHFQNQIRFWGIKPSFAFVAQPQTNGVAERFNKTLKQQVVFGRNFTNIKQVRCAVSAFVELYNSKWRIEKMGFRTPTEARKKWNRENGLDEAAA